METKKQNKIIADYLRYQLSEENNNTETDEEIIEMYGGDTSNMIIVDFDDNTYLYKSVDTNITVYNYIDINKLSNSKSNEPIQY